MKLSPERQAYLSLMREVEDLFYQEADLLDARDYLAWLDLFTEDLRYWMPMRKNVALEDIDRETTGEDDIAWIDDDKATLTKRVKQLLTGVHWAEEPLSRVAHVIANVRLVEKRHEIGEGISAEVSSRFFVYRNRLETETDFLVGRRFDTLRRVDGDLKIARRKIVIEQSVLLAKNLTVFL